MSDTLKQRETDSRQLPALRFEPDAYSMNSSKIMGRQSAGFSFLKAIARSCSGRTVTGFGPKQNAEPVFGKLLRFLNPEAVPKWTSSSDLAAFQMIGAIHLPDPSISEHSRLRVRLGTNAYSITGLIHTISSATATRMITDIPLAPLMPWDALVLTSNAAKSAVLQLIGGQEDYLKWKFKGERPQRPEMPVIPLGVHCEEFNFTAEERQVARNIIGLAEDEIAFLYLGRLSFHAKAHPFPMYAALEAAAQKTGKKIALINCGWFANDFIAQAFKDGAKKFCPSVRSFWLDGTKENERKAAWRGADVFVSLSDNIQETFGLTLTEAMAAGLPVIATDWDGYRDIVVHEETGFLVNTTMPGPRTGDDIALAYAVGSLDYDRYIGTVSQYVSVDFDQLIDFCIHLIKHPDVRKSMGEAGKKRVQTNFDWTVVLGRYETLWAFLRQRRLHAINDKAPQLRGFMADQMDPFQVYADYPTTLMNNDITVAFRARSIDLEELIKHPLFFMEQSGLDLDITRKINKFLSSKEGATLSKFYKELGEDRKRVYRTIAILAKLGAIRFTSSKE
jgi:glycosyltransferase involved in cell wall biosynthesis